MLEAQARTPTVSSCDLIARRDYIDGRIGYTGNRLLYFLLHVDGCPKCYDAIYQARKAGGSPKKYRRSRVSGSPPPIASSRVSSSVAGSEWSDEVKPPRRRRGRKADAAPKRAKGAKKAPGAGAEAVPGKTVEPAGEERGSKVERLKSLREEHRRDLDQISEKIRNLEERKSKALADLKAIERVLSLLSDGKSDGWIEVSPAEAEVRELPPARPRRLYRGRIPLSTVALRILEERGSLMTAKEIHEAMVERGEAYEFIETLFSALRRHVAQGRLIVDSTGRVMRFRFAQGVELK